MLVEIARKLDRWIVDQNVLLVEEGLLRHAACSIRLLGQSALIEANLGLRLLATRDVDVRADYDDAVRLEFARLLALAGRELDPLGHEVWMPRETRYAELFRGKFVHLLLAEPEAVLLSKALKAPVKNKQLITQYLSTIANERFFELARKYRVDLEPFT